MNRADEAMKDDVGTWVAPQDGEVHIGYGAGKWTNDTGNTATFNLPERDDIDSILEERGNRYGEFDRHAQITQEIKKAMSAGLRWEYLDADKKEALEMIAHKIGRILNGDPNYIESWRDSCGYSQLIVNTLKETDGASDAKVVNTERKDGKWVDC